MSGDDKRDCIALALIHYCNKHNEMWRHVFTSECGILDMCWDGHWEYKWLDTEDVPEEALEEAKKLYALELDYRAMVREFQEFLVEDTK